MDRKLDAQFQRENLHWAAQCGDLAAVEKFLAQKYPVNRFDELGKTPLHYAVQEGHLEIIDRLLKAGANVNAHDERTIGNTPLSDNIRECTVAIARRLIDAGADPAFPGWMQLTAIHRAAERKDADARKIQQLLKDAVRRKRQ